MSLWVDKYRPKELSKLDYHIQQAGHLKKLVECGDFPHLLVYGPPGAGKKTRIMCLLRELYGAGVERLRIEHQNFQCQRNDSLLPVVVLTEVDKLTKDAQHALRRTMEKYMATCRLILCANSTSKVIPAIRSRCLGVRVAAPSELAISQILQVHRGSPMNELKQRWYPFTAQQAISSPDWEIFLQQTATKIMEEQSPNRLLVVRERIYELLTHCIPPEVIFKGLLKELVRNCDGELKFEVTSLAAYHEHRLNLGSKAIYHIEAFIAAFMARYKRFLEESVPDIF
ncbi:Replication factor C subunit 3-like [Homarus americanus]|uniref:Replication factor C subunit 3-like n=1 Tax=Homarus americanus TaxID=6706 RepID=A0A8J5JVG7_HOMAM|nr:Replication factor C subunit 3-like [Homarus americanus]